MHMYGWVAQCLLISNLQCRYDFKISAIERINCTSVTHVHVHHCINVHVHVYLNSIAFRWNYKLFILTSIYIWKHWIFVIWLHVHVWLTLYITPRCVLQYATILIVANSIRICQLHYYYFPIYMYVYMNCPITKLMTWSGKLYIHKARLFVILKVVFFQYSTSKWKMTSP